MPPCCNCELSGDFSGHILGQHPEPFPVVPDEGILHVESLQYRVIELPPVGTRGSIRLRQSDPQPLRRVAAVVEVDPPVREQAGGGIGHQRGVPRVRLRLQNRFLVHSPRSCRRVGFHEVDADVAIDLRQKFGISRIRFSRIGRTDEVEIVAPVPAENGRIMRHPQTAARFRRDVVPVAVRPLRRIGDGEDDPAAEQIPLEHRKGRRPAGGEKTVFPVAADGGAAPDPLIRQAEAACGIPAQLQKCIHPGSPFLRLIC